MKSHGEIKVIKILKELLGSTPIQRNYHVGNKLSIDIYIPSLNIGIEYDGVQHSKRTKFFHEDNVDFLNQQARDRTKEAFCEDKGIALVRINYDEDVTVESISKIIKENMNNRAINQAKVARYKQDVPEHIREKQREYRRQQYEKRKAYMRRFVSQNDSSPKN